MKIRRNCVTLPARAHACGGDLFSLTFYESTTARRTARLTLLAERAALRVFEHNSNNSITIPLHPPPLPRSLPSSRFYSPSLSLSPVSAVPSCATIVWRARRETRIYHLPCRHLHDATVYPSRRLPRGLIIINHVNFTITGDVSSPPRPSRFYAVESRREKVWQSKTSFTRIDSTRLMSTTGIIRSADSMSIIRRGRES